MSTKQITKNQHYVPQHYFRNFNKGNRFICTHILASDTIIEKTSISGQASKNFFYGNQDFEDKVCEVENKIRSGLMSIIKRREVSNATKLGLINYISYQEVRTSKKRNQIKAAMQTIEAFNDLSGSAKTIDEAKQWFASNTINCFKPDEKKMALESNEDCAKFKLAIKGLVLPSLRN